jgi:hypothetical protein
LAGLTSLIPFFKTAQTLSAYENGTCLGGTLLHTNLLAAPPKHSFQDTPATGADSFFYRVRLE